jgi:hypothetical protein
MPERLLGTGVTLRVPRCHAGDPKDPLSRDAKSGDLRVEIQVFAELEDGPRPYRIGGSLDRASVSSTADPTKELVALAHEAREVHLGNLLGDLRSGGCDITRFEFYSSPFRIELSPDLREAFRGVWKERPPRLETD